MRRVIAALIVTTVVVMLLVNFHAHVPALQTRVVSRPATATSGAAAGGATTANGAAARSRTVRSAVGDAIQYEYGIIQLKATVKGSQLTKVELVTLNPSNDRSQGIDAQAVPLLRQEALQAHSANIDVVSGATYTSQAYAQSLQSAIDRARSA